VVFSNRGMMVIQKPPGWEVDSVTNDTDALCLSKFLQQGFTKQTSPLLHDSSYGFGFIHRLDVASSGLVLIALTMEGLLALQWQKSLYLIGRDYVVVSYDLEVGGQRRCINAKVSVPRAKVSRTVTEDRGLPASSHVLTQAHLHGGELASGMRLSKLVIRIHTGRRHQIRAHTRLIGHPTACDGWYAPAAASLTRAVLYERVPTRAWVRTPRWEGELTAPPPELHDHVSAS